MADDLDIVSLPEAYEAINNPAASGHDAQLARWITGVSRRIDDLCGPVVARTVTGELHDGGDTVVFLNRNPVDSITTVTEYDDTTSTTLTEETNATKPDDAYLVETFGSLSALRRRSGGVDATFVDGRKNVEVDYKTGRYADTAAVDPKFKMAVAGILRRLWARDAGAWARGSDPFDVGSQAFFDAFKQSMKEFLDDEVRAGGVA